MNAKKFRNIFLIFGSLILGCMVYKIGLDIIVNNILRTGWWFFAIIGVWIPIYILNASSWFLIISDRENKGKISFFKTLKLTISGYALNYISPGGLVGGEPYRVMELRELVGTHKATSSVIAYAMMHFLSHFFFWLFSILLVLIFLPVDSGLMITLSIVFAVCITLIFLFFRGYRKGLLVKIFNVLQKMPVIRKWARKFVLKNEESLKLIDEQIAELHNNRRIAFYTSLFLDFMARIVGSLEVFFILTALGQDVTVIGCIIIIGISSLFANLFFFSPMQLGTREAGFALALTSLSLPLQLGVSVSLITRIRELAWILIGLLLIKIRPAKGRTYKQIVEEEKCIEKKVGLDFTNEDPAQTKTGDKCIKQNVLS